MQARPHAEVVFRLRYAQFVEEYLRHIGIVVLSRVQYMLRDTVGISVSDGTTDGSCLYYLRPGSYDGE